MNKIFKPFLIMIFIMILTGCSKNYSAINYSKFLGEFNNKKEYTIIDKTVIDEGVYKRSYEAGNSKYTFFYFQFNNKKEAKNYMVKNYKNKKHFSYKEKESYNVAKTNIDDYLIAIQTDDIVIIGQGKNFLSRFQINKIIKEIYE